MTYSFRKVGHLLRGLYEKTPATISSGGFLITLLVELTYPCIDRRSQEVNHEQT
jgi:hypothetical protein